MATQLQPRKDLIEELAPLNKNKVIYNTKVLLKIVYAAIRAFEAEGYDDWDYWTTELGEAAFSRESGCYLHPDRHRHGQRMGWCGFVLAIYALFYKRYPEFANKFSVADMRDLTRKHGLDKLMTLL